MNGNVPKITNFLNQNSFPDKCETELSNSMTCYFDSENLCGWKGENVQFGRGETFTSNTGPSQARVLIKRKFLKIFETF